MNQPSFNPTPPTILYIDLNSCFATIEQQANPHLRGKPVAVAAYTTPNGCILAPSIEAKRFGVKTGMRVKNGKLLCPGLIILESDPWKYRNVHLALRKLLTNYTYAVVPKSIDEFVLNFENFVKDSPCSYKENPLKVVAQEIKQRIKSEIGDWLTVSIGIAPNRFLAKLAAGLHKPDGLDEINKDNFLDCYLKLKLTDLPYIKIRNAIRLGAIGIHTVVDFYNAPIWKLKAAFESINGYYWFLRLKGWEIDNVEFGGRSYGNSYALPKPLTELHDLSPILTKLVTKMGARLRQAGYKARGVHLAIGFRDGSFWHKGESSDGNLFDSRDIYKKALRMLSRCPYKKPVRDMAVAAFGLRKIQNLQLDLFTDVLRKEMVVRAVDRVNERFGDFIVTPARMLYLDKKAVPDRIAFGGVKEIEEFTIQ